MKKLIALTLLFACITPAAQKPQQVRQSKKPKLILGVLVDQFRYDYLTRFRQDYNRGISRLLDQGAVFTNAHFIHFPTVTAIGHAAWLSGATPSISGIVGNEWYDRELGKQVDSVTDAAYQLVGTEGNKPGLSPKYLQVSTISDELKLSGAKSRSIGIAMKDRGAILPVGHMADAAYWFDDSTGRFVTSTYYMKELPGWAKDFNNSGAADKLAGKTWLPVEEEGKKDAKPYRTLPVNVGRTLYDSVKRTPYGSELIIQFAQRAIESEQLGRGEGTDVLTLSFSSNDWVGHALGPDAPEVRDISIRTDRMLGGLFDYLDKRIGMSNVVVVFTADHGVAQMPELNQKRKMLGGRYTEAQVRKLITEALTKKYGAGTWVLGKTGPAPYLNHALIREKNLSLEEVREDAAEAVRSLPHVARVYTANEVRRNQLPGDQVDQRLRNSYHERRASDLFLIVEPYWMFSEDEATHGSPYSYDSHVPVIFMGPGVKSGKYHRFVAVNDIAPTLATILEIETPSGSTGRVLDEILAVPAGTRTASAGGR
jgi:predicted AlkP superfamily pyrophosphatase or phosphodiesterase